MLYSKLRAIEIYCMPSLGPSKYIEINLQITWVYSGSEVIAFSSNKDFSQKQKVAWN